MAEEEGDEKGGAAKKKKQDRPMPVDDDPHGEKLASKVNLNAPTQHATAPVAPS
jgi:hypothetical protein